MNTVINTIEKTIYEKQEIIKTLNAEKDDLVNILCEKHHEIKHHNAILSNLKSEVKELYDIMKTTSRDGCNLSPQKNTSNESLINNKIN